MCGGTRNVYFRISAHSRIIPCFFLFFEFQNLFRKSNPIGKWAQNHALLNSQLCIAKFTAMLCNTEEKTKNWKIIKSKRGQRMCNGCLMHEFVVTGSDCACTDVHSLYMPKQRASTNFTYFHFEIWNLYNFGTGSDGFGVLD